MTARMPIVLLEDDLLLREIMAEGLRASRFDVIEVDEPERASAVVDQLDGHAILVADRAIGAGLPNGFQVASDALSRYPALKVIYTSGTHIAVRRRKLSERERGLLKPFAVSQLVAAINQLQ